MQGLVAPIAISSLVALVIVSIVKAVKKVKGDDAMGSRRKEFVNTCLDVLFTMSANLAGGALLTKALQSQNEFVILNTTPINGRS